MLASTGGATGGKPMAKRVEYVFDYVSPYAYLANTQLPGLGVPVEYRPVAIVEVMKLVNNQPSPACPPKGRYAALDAKRWADLYGVAFASNARLWAAMRGGEFNPKTLILGTLAAKALGVFEAYHDAMFDAVWGHPQDVHTPEGRDAFAGRQGLAGVWEKAGEAAIADQAQKDIAEAAERGVFGVPTFFVDDEIFFGNDRLDFVRARLAGVALKQGAAA
jgi:2-hydroxychromene-2-carboxylate isomerase